MNVFIRCMKYSKTMISRRNPKTRSLFFKLYTFTIKEIGIVETYRTSNVLQIQGVSINILEKSYTKIINNPIDYKVDHREEFFNLAHYEPKNVEVMWIFHKEKLVNIFLFELNNDMKYEIIINFVELTRYLTWHDICHYYVNL